MERYECRECRKGPSESRDWPYDARLGRIYCPWCKRFPMLVIDTETTVVADLNTDQFWPIEYGEAGA